MAREHSQSDLQHDLASALRPTILFFRLLKPLQLAAHIDKHAGKLWPNDT
jgi:hypothetical protein